MSKTFTLAQFKKWGAKGGKKSRRTLTSDQALAMVRARKDRQVQVIAAATDQTSSSNVVSH